MLLEYLKQDQLFLPMGDSQYLQGFKHRLLEHFKQDYMPFKQDALDLARKVVTEAGWHLRCGRR